MKSRRHGALPGPVLAGFALVLVAIAAGGVWFHRSQAEFIRHRAEAELASIGRLKANEIARWRAEKLADARSLTGASFFAEGIATWFDKPEAAVTNRIAARLDDLRHSYHYRDVVLVDLAGKVRLASPPDATTLSDLEPLQVEAALREKQPVLGEFHRDSVDGAPSIDLIAPLLLTEGDAQVPIGAVILDLDPNEVLYPLIQTWPGPSATAETLLVRRDGDSVLFLNDLRHKENAALSLRIPLTEHTVPAVQAVQGVRGAMEGIDYRGVPVLSTLEPVPNSPWFVVAKIDTEEALAEMQMRTLFVLAATFGLFALTIAAGILWHAQTRKKHLLALQRIEWLLHGKTDDPGSYVPSYGNLADLNTERTIIDSVGADAIRDLVGDFLDLLGSSSALYEKNGAYAAGIFSSGWCRALDQASFDRCGSTNAQQALAGGRWHCHESCWSKAAKEAIATGKPVDIECAGGIRLYAIPIRIGDEIIGAINFGYGDPPRDQATLARISGDFGIPVAKLRGLAEEYEPRPQFIIDIARGRLESAARMIALLVERKRFEDSLADEREQLTVTLRSIGDAVISTDINGRIQLMNRVAEDLTGWTFDDARGRPLAEVFRIVNEQTRVPCENPVDKVLQTGIVVSLANHTALIARDGTERSIADSGAPIRDRNSRTIGVVLVFRDVTVALKSEVQILRAQKLESLGLLAGGIAHDFNNLLGGIFGHVEMARYSTARGETAQAAESLSKALAVFERARNLTQQLLTFSKGGAPRKKTGQLRKPLEDVVAFALSGSNVRCQFAIAPNLWPCDFDESQIVQVIDNLVINAKHAMANGGTFEVGAENVNLTSGPVTQAQAVRFVRLSFKDHGIGIPPENLTRIFDPFFSTKQTGSGLGLATCHSIVQQHGGYIEVQSELGKGSTFFVFLPASAAEVQDVAGSPDALRSGTGRILVMDDEEFIRDVVTDQLSTLGYTVVAASNGRDALTLYREASARRQPFDLVILDMTVPGGWGGIETIKELHRLDPAAKVILSSGYSAHPAMTDPVAFGFTAGIQKPFDQKQLATVVALVLGRA